MSKLTLIRAKERFENYIHQKRKAKSTATAYLTDYSQFQVFMKDKYFNITYVHQLTKQHYLDYFDYLFSKSKNGEIKAITMDRKRDSLIIFSRFLLENGYTDVDVLDSYSYKRITGKYVKDLECEFNPYILTDDDKEAILKSIIDSRGSNKHRDFAIMQILCETGIRRSTLLQIKWEDINFARREMVLHHVKTKNITTIKISEGLALTLDRLSYITMKKIGYIFLSNKGNRLSESSYNDVIKKYVRLAKLEDKGVTGHSFRHTFVTELLRKNISPYKIIKYTGHSRVESLKPYEALIAKDCEDVIGISSSITSKLLAKFEEKIVS
jgi:site-specific recombinase XerD